MADNTIDMIMAEDPEKADINAIVAYLRRNRGIREDNKLRGKRAKPEKAEQQVLSLAELGFKPPTLNIKRRV